MDTQSLLPTGTTLLEGRYRIERYLSSGNFGNTYVVTDTVFGELLAMKEFFLRGYCFRAQNGKTIDISPAVTPERVNVQRDKFKKEARRLRELTNEHLVHVHNMFEENNTVYYIMDYVRGESLAAYMERTGRPLSEEQVLYLLNQMLDGLDEIHVKKIWHLDLKPDNMMIDKDGKLVIIDFGASKQIGRSGQYTGTTGVLCYTPGFAPLEQVNQDMNSLGPWTDIYALGATLYNLLTNQTPSIQNSKNLAFPSTVSPKTKRLIMWMMSLEIGQRPQSISQIRQYLNSVTKPEQPKKNQDSKFKKNVLLAVIGAIILMFVGFLAFSGHSDSSSTEPDAVNLYYKSALGICSYTGSLDDNGQPHGTGEASFTDGRYYKGSFNHGVMEGTNAYFRYPNGDEFEGTFENNSFSYGRYKKASSGNYFKGYFRNGQPDDGTWYDQYGDFIETLGWRDKER